MTDESIIQALAELDGWTFIPSHDKQIGHEDVAVPDKWSHVDGYVCYEDAPENYLTSYDAIVPLIQKQPSQVQQKLWKELELEDDFYPYQKTPRQLCIALLKAVGKWEE